MKIKEIRLSNKNVLKGVIENGKTYYSIQAVAKSCGFTTEQAKTLKRRLLKNKLTRELLSWKKIPTTVENQFGWTIYEEDIIYIALSMPSMPDISLVVVEARSNSKIYRFSHTIQELKKNPYRLIFNLLTSSFENVLSKDISAIRAKEDIENLSYEEVIKKYPEEIKNMENIIKEELIKRIYIDPSKQQESYRLFAVQDPKKDLIFLSVCSPNVPVLKEMYTINMGFEDVDLVYLSEPIINAIEVRNKIRANFLESKLERGWIEANKNEFLEFIKNEIEPNLK